MIDIPFLVKNNCNTKKTGAGKKENYQEVFIIDIHFRG